MPRTLSDNDRIDLFANGLHAALDNPGYVQQARDTCCEWLEAAAQRRLPADVVTEVIARTCHDCCDIGRITAVVTRWARMSDGEPTPLPREDIMGDLLQKTVLRDPLMSGSGHQGATMRTGENDQ